MTTRKRAFIRGAVLGSVSALSLGLAVATTAAQAADQRARFDIPAQPLSQALAEFSRQSKANVLAPSSLTRGRTSAPVSGELTPEDALKQLLGDTPLKVEMQADGSMIIASAVVQGRRDNGTGPTRLAQMETQASRPAAAAGGGAEEGEDDEIQLEEMVVTGTLIRGIAPDSSPTITFSRDDIDRSGFQTTEQFIRSIPQTFGGGANLRQQGLPGDLESSSNNVNGAGVNLRGLGASSTLTLLNGRRLSPAGSDGSFVDISAIPLSAIERVEVLTDGASAIYGADAVAGVVNFVLRDDFDGAETGLGYGLVTEGDLDQFRASQTFGKSWRGGNGLVAYEYFNQDALFADEKGFAEPAPDPLTLLPGQERHSIFAAVSQSITDELAISFNGTYSRSDTDNVFNNGRGFLSSLDISSEQYLVSPSIEYTLPGSWRVQLSGDYSETSASIERVSTDTTTNAVIISADNNKTSQGSVDLLADGPLFTLAGGSVRAAVGASYRSEDISNVDVTVTTDTFDALTADRDVYAVFGELFVPLVSEDNRLPGVDRLEVSAAIRYDDFSDFGGTLNPKIGVLWSPIAGLNLRASYGTSFNPPNLGQIGDDAQQAITAFIPDPNSPTGVSPVLITLGGTNPELEAEESRTYTAGFDYEFDMARGRVSVSSTYYNIDFDNRIGLVPFPPGGPFQTLVNRDQVPAEIVIESPADDLVQLLLDNARASIGVLDASGGVLTGPGDFDFLIDLNVRNLASVKTSGVDFQVSYQVDTDIGQVNASVAGDHIIGFDERAASNTPVFDAVGTIFRPTDLRLRGSLGWSNDAWTVSTFINHTTSYEDRRNEPFVPVDAYTTVDLNIACDLGAWAPNTLLAGTRLSLSLLNLLGQDPPAVVSAPGVVGVTVIPYDSTNADPLGRFISVQVTKRW